jgi:hypothetical protein
VFGVFQPLKHETKKESTGIGFVDSKKTTHKGGGAIQLRNQ